MLATLAATLWLVALEPQRYEWEPADGPVAGYEVEIRWSGLQSSWESRERVLVTEPAITIGPRLHQRVRLRTRALSLVSGWPPGEWSEWSSERVGWLLDCPPGSVRGTATAVGC